MTLCVRPYTFPLLSPDALGSEIRGKKSFFVGRYRPRANELAYWLRLVKRPQRELLAWFGGPKLASALSLSRSKLFTQEPQVRERFDRPSFPFAASGSLDEFRAAKSGEVRWIPLALLRSARGQVFSAENHPYVCFLQNGYEGMKSFFKDDQPQNLNEYFGLTQYSGPKLDSAVVKGRVWPWSPAIGSVPEPPSFPFWRAGPKKDSHIAQEAHRLWSLLRSVEKKGFWSHPTGLPWYFLLINDTNIAEVSFRAVVMHGNHRVAVLAHLGWPAVPMTPPPTMLSNEVRISNILSWPGVLDGSFTETEARALFLAFFR